MDTSIAKVLSHVYELEGLLLVADKHGAETPKMVFDRIHDVAQEVNGMAQMLEYKEPPAPQPEPQPAPQPEAKPEPEPQPVVASQEVETPAPVPQPEKQVEPLAEPEPQPMEEPAIPQVEKITQVSQPVVSEPQPVLRVDEQLQRHISQDLRNALSINDKFRFKRNVFNDSEALMEQTIDRIERLSSEQQARDYLINVLHRDENDPDVADFLKIVSSHFA